MVTGYPTHARTLIFNHSNWSGEETTIEVEEGNRFEVHGHTFWLVDTTPKGQEDKPGDKFYFRRLELHGDGWDDFLTKICWFDGDDSLEGHDPVIAAARYIFMCV